MNIVELSLCMDDLLVVQNRLTSLSMFILPSWHSLTSINLGIDFTLKAIII